MPGNVAGAIDAPLDIFGGLVTDMAAPDLPPGVSPDCADVAFIMGGVKTRPGLLSVYSALAGNPTVNYLKTYITLNQTLRLLAMDSLGNLSKETTPGVLTNVTSGLAINAYGKSTTLFGREYIAISDGKIGNDMPRQFDDTNFDRVSQVGPGAPPAAADSASAGSLSPGAHQVAVIFKTRQGYLTRPSPPATWTSAGSKQASITNIPIGPSNVVARILAFTGAGGASFFYLSSMVIADNTTTTLTLDFSDTQLLAGTNVDYLFKLVELGECSGVIDYAQRLFWWGERNKQNNWLNPTFDGGFSGGVPLGWTADATFGAGGSKDSTLSAWGDAYRITGDGTTATRGLITQPAVKDFNGVALVSPNVDTSVRARVLKGGGLTQGTLHVHLFSVSASINTTGLQVTAGQAGSAYAEFTAQLTPPLATVPSDLVLRVYADGTPTPVGGFFTADNIEIYPTNQPNNTTLVRGSRTSDPESYDGVNGIMSVAENNGQSIRSAFKLRERLYFVKEHSLYVTQDDGVNEPALWSIEEVSRSMGTPSVNGVDVGEDWAVILDRSGLYIYAGGEPVKISQEIQPLWDSINWQYGHTAWVRVDTRNKRVLCGVPITPATSPNRVLYMDYRALESGPEIAGSGPLHISFGGKLIVLEKTRKWAPWFITATSAAMVERTDGTAQFFLGNGVANGKIYQLSDTQLSDDGAAINSYYTTYYFLHHELEQAFQLSSHRKLFTYLTTFVEGAGLLSLTAFIDSTAFTSAQQPLALSSPATKDLELPINVLGERVAFKVGTNLAGNWFRLQKFVPVLRTDPWAPVRGVN